MAEDTTNPATMWDERFGRPEPVYGEEPNQYLREQSESKLKSGMAVLVPGDGYGRNGLWLAKQGLEVTTVELSEVGVERARNWAARAGISAKILLNDLLTWAWPVGEFDAVASIYLHLIAGPRQELHGRMAGALKPGGIVILEAFTPAQLAYSSGGPKTENLLYTAEMLRGDFASEEVVELAEREVNLSEGQLHSGKAAVVRGVFRKR